MTRARRLKSPDTADLLAAAQQVLRATIGACGQIARCQLKMAAEPSVPAPAVIR